MRIKPSSFGIRHLWLVILLLLAVTLNACSFTTDTVATVGPEKITRGELNAEVKATGQPAATALNYLITSRLLELEARAQGITLSDAEVRTRIGADVAATGAQLQDQRDQERTALAMNAAQSIRPIIDAAGGAGLPQAELLALLGDEIGKMQNQLDARGTLLASTATPQFTQDRAISMRNALAAKGVAVAPGDLEPTVAAIVQQLGTGGISAADAFQQSLAQQGLGGALYQQVLRIQLLIEKMRPAWSKPEIEAATFKLLVTESQERASEAAQKGRAGTPFDDLLKSYASAVYQDPQAVDYFGSAPISSLPASLRSSFATVQQGQYSEPFPLAAGLYGVVYIQNVERRAPTSTDENALIGQWLEGLHAKYAVNIDPSLNVADPATTP